jgi:hypothetical protein
MVSNLACELVVGVAPHRNIVKERIEEPNWEMGTDLD